MSVDLIYRMLRDAPYDADQSGFFIAKKSSDAVRMLPFMIHDRGLLQAAKLALKVALRRCCYFGIAKDGKPLTTGILAMGYCKFYPVSADSIVIGEIATDAAHRGEGHATRAIKLAVNSMLRGGSDTFYIDTQRHNAPMIRSIEKLGFGPAVAGSAGGTAT
jgi:hypothetical protein